MWKLPASRKLICGMGKRFYGISGSSNIGGTEEQQRQQVALNLRMQAIEEKMQKIVQLRDKEYGQQQMDVVKMVSEQCQKQMAQQNAKMEKSFMESQEKMATKFNGKLSELERKLKSIEAIKFGNPIENSGKTSDWNAFFNDEPLNKFRIDFPIDGNAPGIYTDEDMEWPLPDVPMPSNITNFKEIHLCYFDESVLGFLRQFQLNSLLSNVNLEFKECKSGALMAFLTKFMPLIESVDSITDVGQSFLSLLEHSPLANSLLTSARVFDILAINENKTLIGNWLTTPRADGKPRLLFLKPYRYYDFYGDFTETINTCSSLIEYIKQDFMHAKQAASFYIKIVGFDSYDMRKVLAPLSLQNTQTGEKLVIKKIEVKNRQDFDLIISRFPIGTNEEEWHREMAQYSDSNSDNRYDNVGQYDKKEYRNIIIDI